MKELGSREQGENGREPSHRFHVDPLSNSERSPLGYRARTSAGANRLPAGAAATPGSTACVAYKDTPPVTEWVWAPVRGPSIDRTSARLLYLLAGLA
jgi:hypothetical protein